jgi:hypothetical protein
MSIVNLTRRKFLAWAGVASAGAAAVASGVDRSIVEQLSPYSYAVKPKVTAMPEPPNAHTIQTGSSMFAIVTNAGSGYTNGPTIKLS